MLLLHLCLALWPRHFGEHIVSARVHYCLTCTENELPRSTPSTFTYIHYLKLIPLITFAAWAAFPYEYKGSPVPVSYPQLCFWVLYWRPRRPTRYGRLPLLCKVSVITQSFFMGLGDDPDAQPPNWRIRGCPLSGLYPSTNPVRLNPPGTKFPPA